MPFLNARGFTCVVNSPWSPGPVFSPSRLAKVRCSSWLFDGSPGKRAVGWSRSEILNTGGSQVSAAYVRKTTLGQLPCKEGSSPFSAAIFLCRRNARSNCGETGAGHQARTCKGNVISHGRIRALVVSACGASIAQSRKERMGRYGHMTLQPA